MAEFEAHGIYDIVRALKKIDDDMRSIETEMIDAGADELIGIIKEEVGRSGFDLVPISRKLGKSKKAKIDREGKLYKMVTVHGKNIRGERNATVFFVLNYGRGKEYGEIHGGYFWTTAVHRYGNQFTKTCEGILNNHLKERGLQ